MTLQDAKVRRTAPLRTPSNLSSNSVTLISAALTEMLAHMFALYLKTKNFHWHVSGASLQSEQRRSCVAQNQIALVLVQGHAALDQCDRIRVAHVERVV